MQMSTTRRCSSWRQRRALAGRADRHQAVRAGSDLPIDQGAERRFVDFSVLERGDQGRHRTVKLRPLFHLAYPDPREANASRPRPRRHINPRSRAAKGGGGRDSVVNDCSAKRRHAGRRDNRHDRIPPGRCGGGADRVVRRRSGVGPRSAESRSPRRRRAFVDPAPRRAGAATVVAPTVVAARALAPPPRLDLTPVGAIARAAPPPPPRPAPRPRSRRPPRAPMPVGRACARAAARRRIRRRRRRASTASALAAAAALYRKGDLAGGDALAAKASDAGRTRRLRLAGAAARAAARRQAPRRFRRRPSALAGRRLDPRGRGGAPLRRPSVRPKSSPRASPAIRRARRPASSPWRAPRSNPAAATRRRRSSRRYGAASDLDPWSEAETLKDFAALLTRADHKYRADRLLYAEKPAAALRAAALAGPDEVALAEARIAAMNGPLTGAGGRRRAAGAAEGPRPAVRARPGRAARQSRPRGRRLAGARAEPTRRR